MTKLTPSSTNTINPNLPGRKTHPDRRTLKKTLFSLFVVSCLGWILCSCQPTYPSRTLLKQLTQKVKEETNFNVSCNVVGKTLWVFVPCEKLIDENNIAWDTKALEEVSKVITIVHRVALSTDAKLDFLVVVAADVKKYGLELTTMEYLPDIKEAMFEKVSRGEYFMRSVRNISFNEQAIGDPAGEYKTFHDITFDEFIGYQILHRVKALFAKEKKLDDLFEIKSSSSSAKFGIIKVDLEILRKKYNLNDYEKSIKPLNHIKMISAQIIKNYGYKDFQAIEINDTFSDEAIKIPEKDIARIKINLPDYLD